MVKKWVRNEQINVDPYFSAVLAIETVDSVRLKWRTPKLAFPGVKLSAFMLQEILDSCIAEQPRILRCVGRARRVGLMRRFVEGCGD